MFLNLCRAKGGGAVSLSGKTCCAVSWPYSWPYSSFRSLLSAAADLIYYHPYEYVYFNRLGRSLVSVEGFEGDYWNVSTIGVLRHFEDEYYRGTKLKVALMVDAGQGQARSLLNSDKVQIVEEEDADYFLFNYSALHDRSILVGYEPVSWIERGGSVISGVYVKTGNQ